MKAILIDDEPAALEVMEWQLQEFFPQIRIAALCSSADDGIAAIRQHAPDVVFLDVEMPQKNGFEVLKAFEDPQFAVIFTTAYDHFAINAFKYAAFDYLLKPVASKDLQTTMNRLLHKRETLHTAQMKLLLDFYKPVQPATVALHSAEGLVMVKPGDIIWCGSVGNYTQVHMHEGLPFTVTRQLREAEDALAGYRFFRIHNSYLINLAHVTRYVRTEGNYVVMSDGKELPVSRKRKDAFLEQYLRL